MAEWFAYSLPIMGGHPRKCRNTETLEETFSAEIDFDPTVCVLNKDEVGPWRVIYDLVMFKRQAPHNMCWENLVRKQTQAPIPALRGPVVVLAPRKLQMDWTVFRKRAAEKWTAQIAAVEETPSSKPEVKEIKDE